MKKYIVYFSLFGKKMKTEVYASSLESAQNQIKNKIVFDKIESKEIKDPLDEFLKGFKK